MSTTTVLTTEKPRRWLARRRGDVEKMLGGGKRDDDYVPERLKHAARPATKPDRALQLVFALGLLVPFVVFAFLDPDGARDAFALQYATIRQLRSYILSSHFVAAVLCLSVERACYTLVWCCPWAFGEFCSKHNLGPPVDVIVRLFGVNKFFQLLGFAHLYLLGGLAPPPSLFALGVGAALVVWGQALNVGIYRAIGKAGVYYGYKFGVAVPWCTGFPFTLGLAHPQYLGSAATAYGCVLLSLTAAHVPGGYGGLAHAQALLYAYMAYVEHNL